MKIFAIVVTYNGMKWIEECLSSLYESSIPLEVIVVDNCSSDETVVYIKSKFPDVILFGPKENLGFGKANNIGMSYALRQNADFVFLLNQDAFVNKNTIEKLVRIAQSKPEYGVLSPIQLDYSGKLLETYFFRFMAEDNSRSFYSDFVLANQLKEVYDIDFIQAAAWLLPKKTLLEIGGFDPVFFHYGEDDNYCQRLLYHKMKIGVVTNTYIRHDSHKPKFELVVLFSEKYFEKYKRGLAINYANINIEFTKENVSKEIKKIQKNILINIIKLDFVKIKGFLKQLYVFNNAIKLIRISRNRTIYNNANYLNLE